MTALFPLAAAWLAAPLFALADGRRRLTAMAAAALLSAIAAVDAALLAAMTGGWRAPLDVVTGGWPAEIGIRLHVDGLALFFAAVSTAVLAAVLWHEMRRGVRGRAFPALVLFLAAGLHGAFFTGDLFNFYVFFELSVVTSFALAIYGYGEAELRGAFTYVVANLLGSVLFLTAAALVYHMAGTLDLVALSQRAGEVERGMPHLGAALMFAAISVKLGLFPFHGWVPALYSHALPPVAAALSGALINVGAYGLLRFGFLSAQTARADAAAVLLLLGAAAILYGSLAAARRTVPAEIAAYAAIAQAGYVVLAVGIGGRAGAAAGLYAVLAGSIEKTALFLGLESAGLARRFATLAAALGMAGLPLTLGFLAKIALMRAALAVPGGWLLAGAVIVATALLMVAVIRYADAMRRLPAPPRHGGAIPGALGLATVALALAAAPLDLLVESLVDDLLSGGGR